MPATTNVIPSVDFLLKTGGLPIGGGTGATLTLDRAIEVGPHDRYAGWQSGGYSTRGWSLGFEALYLEGAGAPPPVLMGVDVEVTVGGQILKGLSEATLSLSQEINDIVNSSTGLDRKVAPGSRKASLSISADYYDPASAGQTGYAALIDELLGVTSAGVAIVFSVGRITVSFTGLVTQGTVGKSVPDVLTSGITIESNGAVLDTTAAIEPGMAAVFDAFFGTAVDGSSLATNLGVLLGTTTIDNTEFTGSGLLSDLTIAAPLTGRVNVSGTLQGDGPLTRRPTAV